MKSHRFWITPQSDSGSHVVVDVGERDCVDVRMADCNRSITWSFYSGTKSNKTASLKKVRLLKALFTELEAFIESQTPKK